MVVTIKIVAELVSFVFPRTGRPLEAELSSDQMIIDQCWSVGLSSVLCSAAS